MSIACAGYNDQGEFLFISKNPDRNDYHLNTVHSSEKSELPDYSQPLSNITGYPSDINTVFGGLCSFSKSSSSFYLSFDSSTTSFYNITINGTNASFPVPYNTTVATIYQLTYIGNGGGSFNQFHKTPIQLENTTLSSFVQVTDANKTSSLAFIATSTNNQRQPSLNLMSLSEPYLYSTSKAISGEGILAAGGDQSQLLYLIQGTSISEYRFNSMDYTQSILQSHFDMTGIKPGTTGQVYSSPVSSLSNNYYISIFNSHNAQINIIHHNSSRSHFTPLPFANNYVSLGNNDSNSTLLNKSNNTITQSRPITATFNTNTPASSHAASVASNHRAAPTAPSVVKAELASKSIRTHTPSASIVEISGDNRHHLGKRGLYQNGNPGTSTDGTFYYQGSGVTSEDNSPVSAVALADPSLPYQDPPYNIVLLSGNETTGYRSSTMTGSGLSIINTDAPEEGISGGAIAGIVIGVLVSLGIVFGLLIYARKRKNKINPKTRSYGMPLSIQPDDFVTPYMESRDLEKSNHNASNTSSILQEAKCIPEEYHDGNRPDIRPLCYTNDRIEYATPSQNELLMLEPDVQGPLFLFSGQYISSAEERVTYLREGYAIRAFDAKDGSKHTIHYFSAANLDTFVRSVYSVLQCSRSTNNKPAADSNNYVMSSDMAIVLSTPTPHFQYQYIWISSPMIPEQSLYSLLLERRNQIYIDHHNTDYKIWSVYAILKSIESIHSHKIVHLAIDLHAFYYDHETKATDWRLGNFGHARITVRNNNKYAALPPHSSFTAPEIINQKAGAEQETADIWSMGCVIYSVATGGLSLFESDSQVKDLATFKDDLEQHVRIAIRDNVENITFKNILELMLCVDPQERKSIIQVLDLWNSVYNMEG